MLSRLTVFWSCLTLLCVGCALDSSPKQDSRSSHSSSDSDSWQPKGAGSGGRRINQDTEESTDATKIDASKPDVPQVRDSGSPSPSPSDSGTAQPAMPADSSQEPSAPDPSAPTAGDPSEPPSEPAAAGTGGMGGEQASGAAGSAGAAGSGGMSARQSLIDAAIEALGGGDYPWRSGGNEDGLSADFVKSVLFSLVASGTCFRDTRRCVQACFVIASDCKPCAADPECAEALQAVCGPLGTCSP